MTQPYSRSSLVGKLGYSQFFELGASIRNRTRGHGATTSDQCSRLCPYVADALNLIVRELRLFRSSWVYLHRNLSGKYRVSPLLGPSEPFDYLRGASDVSLQDGVYFDLHGHVHVPLVFTDPDLLDIFLPNGNHREGSFELLSYVTNETPRKDGSAWSSPPSGLLPSETEGRTTLEPLGRIFTNLPPRLSGYVLRTILETRVRDELLNIDRHPIVSLTGPGGIGKTSIAIAAIEEIAGLAQPPYEVVVWISARDIDLLESGPKPVAPRVVTQKDIALATVELLHPSERSDPDFESETFMRACLAKGAAGTTLFVFDNFETVQNPADVLMWIDTHIRLPNKVLITTRFRDFVGDYPIEIGGMTDEEAATLIDQQAARLGIRRLLSATYTRELIRESDGHPYVIKILLGQVAKEGRAVKPERVVASADHLLNALFERTYAALTPAGQRVFLLLCSWRSFVPEIAVEAVSLRPGNERFHVAAALDELRRFSLLDQVTSQNEQEGFVGVPLAAAMYGRRKLDVSPFKVAVGEDRRLLMEFGSGRREDVQRGVLPRIENLVRAVAERASDNPLTLKDSLPVLEYVASRVPKAYLRLADLVLEVDEVDGSGGRADKAKEYIRRFLENAAPNERQAAWLRLADLCSATEDAMGEVHALSEAALLPTVTANDIGLIANRLNSRIRELKGNAIEDAWSVGFRVLLERVIETMARSLRRLSATDCSRLAWLYLNVGNGDRARDAAKAGIQRDPNNEHCKRLLERLGK